MTTAQGTAASFPGRDGKERINSDSGKAYEHREEKRREEKRKENRNEQTGNEKQLTLEENQCSRTKEGIVNAKKNIG